VIWALIVHLVAIISEGDTILTLLICLMLSFALRLNFFQISFKTLMFNEFISARKAINALLTWSMIAWLLYFLDIIFGNTETVDALGVRAVIAVRLLYLLIGFWLIRLLFLKCGRRL
jgi:hypothetical protein